MKKLLIFCVLIVSFFSPIFSDSVSVRTFFPSKKMMAVLPVDTYLGQTVSYDATPVHEFLERILTSEFDYNWFFENVDEKVRTPLSAVYSELLSVLLPSSIHYFSKERVNGDESVSISVRFIPAFDPKKNIIISFIVLNEQIVAMTHKTINID